MNKHELAMATEQLRENPVMILQVTKRNKSYNVYPVDGEHDSFRDTRYEHTVGFIGVPMSYSELREWLNTLEKDS